MSNYKTQFQTHKRNAKRRNIDFNLTYEQWLDIWISSGHLDKRGKGCGKYVMSRINDIGPYEVGNVFIQLNASNVSDSVKGKHIDKEHHQKMMNGKNRKIQQQGHWMTGKSRPEFAKKMKGRFLGTHPSSKAIILDDIRYSSIGVCSIQTGISAGVLRDWLSGRRHPSNSIKYKVKEIKYESC